MSSTEKDINIFNLVISSPDYQPYYLKVYPCEVVEKMDEKGNKSDIPLTEIGKWYDRGKEHPDKPENFIHNMKEYYIYRPYAERDNGRELIEVIKEFKRRVPPWWRLNRIVRDIPNQTENCLVGIVGGNLVTNLR